MADGFRSAEIGAPCNVVLVGAGLRCKCGAHQLYDATSAMAPGTCDNRWHTVADCAPAFTASSTCTPECNASDGHTTACACHPVVYVHFSSQSSKTYRDLFAPPVTCPRCPHCGGDLGSTTST